MRGRLGGRIVLATYGRSSGFCIDPVEKKPLYHFLPGTPVLSFGTAGCNLACIHCRRITVADQLLPQDLSTQESFDLVDQIGKPVSGLRNAVVVDRRVRNPAPVCVERSLILEMACDLLDEEWVALRLFGDRPNDLGCRLGPLVRGGRGTCHAAGFFDELKKTVVDALGGLDGVPRG